MARIKRISTRRIVFLAIAAVIPGGYFLARAYVAELFTGRTVIALLIADIVLAPPLLFFALRARERRRKAAGTAQGRDQIWRARPGIANLHIPR